MHSKRSVSLIALAHLVLEICNNGMPVVYPMFVTAGRLTYTQVGVITLVAGLSMSLTQPFLGHISDRWDPPRIIALSMVISGLSMSLVGFSQGLLTLMPLVVVAMIASAAFHPSSATVASTSGWSRRGVAMSLFSVGGNVGAALSPLWLATGTKWFGVAGTLTLIPLALMGSLLLYSQLRRTHVPDRSRMTSRQASEQGGSLAGLIVIVLAVMFRTWLHVSFTTYLPSWFQSQGRSVEVGGQVLFAVLILTGVGSLTGGVLSDRIGRWRSMALSLGLLAPVVWFIGRTPFPLQLAQFGMMGILVGSTFPVSIVAAQEAWPRGQGMAAGLTLGFPWLVGGLGAVVTGSLADSHSMTVALRSLVLPALLGTASILAYPVVTRRWPVRRVTE